MSQKAPPHAPGYSMPYSLYREFVQSLPRSMPRENASPQEVGFLLGVQHTLNLLREKYVTSV